MKMHNISIGNALVMQTYTLFTSLPFYFNTVWMFEIVLKQQQGKQNHGEKYHRNFDVPFWQACPPTLS